MAEINWTVFMDPQTAAEVLNDPESYPPATIFEARRRALTRASMQGAGRQRGRVIERNIQADDRRAVREIMEGTDISMYAPERLQQAMRGEQ